MEFDEHHDQEEEEDEDEGEEQEGEEMGIPVPATDYDSLNNTTTARVSKMGHSTGGGGGVSSTVAADKKGSGPLRYRECLKNHAVGIGGHALDGCGEFMAAGEEGTLDALKCAACNCHRNFHRRETEGEINPFQPPPPLHYHHHHPQLSPYYRTPTSTVGGYIQHHYPPQHPLSAHPLPEHRPLALPAAAASGGGVHSREEEDMSNPSSSGGGSGSKKRFRTKFTQEQKEKMLAFAERLGWRMQKHDDAAVDQFCAEIGVKRQVLKVWMHNNKHSLGKKP